MKPPTKTSITADAINSSLYYLHVSTPNDQHIRKSAEEQRRSYEAEKAPSIPNIIHRKPLPLPSSPKAPTDPRLSSPLNDISSNQSTEPERSKNFWPLVTAASGPQTQSSSSQVESISGGVPRKPVGPRSLVPTPHGSVASIARKPVGSQVVDVGDESSSRFATKKGFGDSGNAGKSRPGARSLAEFEPERLSSQDEDLGATLESENENAQAEGLHIILIRRDPASGSQWNVGNISFAGLASSISITVEIATPGYQKFPNIVHTQSKGASQYETQKGLSPIPQHVSVEIPRAVTPGSTFDDPVPKIFTRKLAMSYPKLSQSRARAQSQMSSNPFRSPERSKRQYLPSKASQLRNAQFSFLSPWNGVCAFSTGMNGRSLKCRHSLPSSGIADIADTADTSAPTAEIRFNLPWVTSKHTAGAGSVGLRGGDASSGSNEYLQYSSRSSLANALGKFDHSSASSVAKASFRNSWQKLKDRSLNRESSDDIPPPPPPEPQPPALPPRPSKLATQIREEGPPSSPSSASTSPTSPETRFQPGSEEFHEEDDIAMDLTLGREKAGGGMRGKSAKLGKLVIEDEGLKMCDLTVAMCMAVWWLYYA